MSGALASMPPLKAYSTVSTPLVVTSKTAPQPLTGLQAVLPPPSEGHSTTTYFPSKPGRRNGHSAPSTVSEQKVYSVV